MSAHQRSLGKANNGGTEESLLAQQTDIVNTVTKLLQQTGEVRFFSFYATLKVFLQVAISNLPVKN